MKSTFQRGECNGDLSTKTPVCTVTSGFPDKVTPVSNLWGAGSCGVNAHTTRIRSRAPRWLSNRAVHRIVCLPTRTALGAGAIAGQFAAACAAANIDAMPSLQLSLIFIRAYIAPGNLLHIWTRLTTLISLEYMAEAVGTAGRIPRINRRAAGREGHGLCLPSVVLQRSQRRIDVVQVASAGEEVTTGVVAQVVTIGGDGAATVDSIRACIRQNSVLNIRPSVDATHDPAIPGKRAAADCRRASAVDANPGAVRSGMVPADGAVVDHQCAAVVDAAALRTAI